MIQAKTAAELNNYSDTFVNGTVTNDAYLVFTNLTAADVNGRIFGFSNVCYGTPTSAQLTAIKTAVGEANMYQPVLNLLGDNPLSSTNTGAGSPLSGSANPAALLTLSLSLDRKEDGDET